MTQETLGSRAIARAISIAWIVAWSLGPIVVGVVTSISSQPDVRAVPARWVPHTRHARRLPPAARRARQLAAGRAAR